METVPEGGVQQTATRRPELALLPWKRGKLNSAKPEKSRA